jgi:hypothetical protein
MIIALIATAAIQSAGASTAAHPDNVPPRLAEGANVPEPFNRRPDVTIWRKAPGCLAGVLLPDRRTVRCVASKGPVMPADAPLHERGGPILIFDPFADPFCTAEGCSRLSGLLALQGDVPRGVPRLIKLSGKAVPDR